jgi:transcription termination factor Rho
VPGGGPVASRETAEESPRPPQAPPPAPSGDAEPREPRPQPSPAQQRDGHGPPNPTRESRSKRRREKRKRRQRENQDQGGHGQQNPPNRQRHEGAHPPRAAQPEEDRRPIQLNGPKIEASGMLELAPKGFGFLRVPNKNFEQARDDVFVTPETIRKYHLRVGQWVRGVYQEGPRGPQLVEISTVNEMPPEEAGKLPHFDELKAINPTRRISFETTPERFTTRVIDIMAPVGRGQRGLIVSRRSARNTTRRST